MKKERISPIKDKPRRHAGQSLDEEILGIVFDKLLPYLVITAFLIAMALEEWWKYYYNIPPSPKLVSFFAFISILIAIYKYIAINKKLVKLKLGRDGERAVSEILELLREKGYKIYHDIVANNFNIDHIIICHKGIFLIETKTLQKDPNKDSKLYFNGTTISIDNIELQKNPLIQVTATKNWLKEEIKNSTGKEFAIKPVIAFIGWYVETTTEGKKADCWVLNPKALASYIDNAPDILSQDEVMMISYHISRYIRTKAKELELKN
jgi:Nuclease-related domain